MNGKVTLVTVVGQSCATLAQMIEHYRGLGVEEVIIHINASSEDDPVSREVFRIADTYSCRVASRSIGPWLVATNTTYYALHRSTRLNDWFILADADELQAYPLGLMSYIEHCDERGYDYIEGCLLDRVTMTGELSSVSLGESMWDQYPLAGFVTPFLTGGVVNKIVAAKGHVKIGHGQHNATSGRGCPVSEAYIAVHHFKWTGGVAERLMDRIKLPEYMNGAYHRECARFAEYYKQYGRIDVDAKESMFSRCDKDYAHWHKILEWRKAVRCFTPFAR